MTDKEKYHIIAMNALGIETEGKSYQECVDMLIHEHIKIMDEIEVDNRETFKRELKRLITQRTN